MLLNRRRAEQVMARHELDALVASSPENVLYCSGYECLPHWINAGIQPFAVLTPGHNPPASLIAPMFVAEAIVDGDVWIDQIYLTGHYWRGQALESQLDASGKEVRNLLQVATKMDSPVDALVHALESRGLGRGRIGVDERGVTPQVWQQVALRFPNAQIVPAAEIWWDIRAIKTGEEVRRLRTAARIAEDAVNAALALARPGRKESEVVHEYFCQLAARRAQPTVMFFGSGSRTAHPIPLVSDKLIEEGDLVRYDIGCRYNYYHTDTARAYVIGKPTDLHRRIWDPMVQGTEDGIALVRPGADPKDIYEATMGPARAAGLENFGRTNVGHGVGLTLPDSPSMKPAYSTAPVALPSLADADTCLCENMVFTVEVGYHIQGALGVLCEDVMLVTADGYERLTNNSKQLSLLQDQR